MSDLQPEEGRPASAESDSAALFAEQGPSSSAPRRRRRRGSRGGARRKAAAGASAATASTVADGAAPLLADGADRRPDDLPDPPYEGRPPAATTAAPTADAAPAGVEDAPARPARPRIGDTRPAPTHAAAPAPGEPPRSEPAVEIDGERRNPSSTSGAARRRRRRAGASRRAGSGGTAAETTSSPAATRAAGRPRNRGAAVEVSDAERRPAGRDARERHGRPVGRYLMCVQVRGDVTQIAVLEGRALLQHFVSRPQDDVSQIDGNIYLGRVQNVLPGMEAAFVDIGTPKNAVLYRGDLRYDADDVEGASRADARIENLLRPGQVVVCQVTKNPIGTKGARLTQEVSLPGRFVVLVPNSDAYGISKRLPDDERRRLRRILDDIKPSKHGLIVRTAAEGATADELAADVARLTSQWEAIDSQARRAKAPALLYQEPPAAVRVIREEFNSSYRGVIIDDPTLWQEVHDYVGAITPELADRVEYFDAGAAGLPIFEQFHVHEQIHKALDRKVWLPSGGSLIIERTEALTVIDVNTGRNVGSSSLEETVYRNNLEAAEEIARQLRLRDIGGIIVIDFIDMEIRQNREDVMRTFRSALARDKTRTQAFDISELGLVEMTRKRISEGLVESLSHVCPTCDGRGLLVDEDLY
ncbi:MAG TPA: Rne/Rng family ribonuclease [Acidimicrobiales bacterium]|nr:Rne/Rng family ribonuclease [Acidimicrobiales bacterium]